MSYQLLTDEMLQNWPAGDRSCQVNCQSGWNVRHWTGAIRSQDVVIKHRNVVLKVDRVREIESLDPLKNALGALCRAIRGVAPHSCIYICNSLPRFFAAPVLGQRVDQHNRLLFQAIQGINTGPRGMGKIFYVGMYEHFLI